MTGEASTFTGSCHCGAVTVALRTPAEQPPPASRACGCSFCTKHGAVWTSAPDGALSIYFDAPDHIRRYRFGLEITDFLLCATCGVPCAAVGTVDDRLRGVVNVNALDRASEFANAAPASFDGEDVEDRVARRRKGWTPAAIVRRAAETD